MTDIQIEERSSKKKLLVPLVVLMLCGVALVGAAYAYTTTVEIDSNKVDSKYYAIDVYANTDGPLTTTVTGPMTINDVVNVYSVKKNNDIEVKAEAVDGGSNLCYVTLFLNKDSVPSTDAEKTEAGKITMALATETQNWAAGGTAQAPTLTYSNTTNESNFELVLTFTLGAITDGYRAVTVAAESTGVFKDTGSALEAVKELSNAIDSLEFNITFSYTAA